MGFAVLDELRQDGGYAFRTLLRAPGFSAAVTLILGLGIGANSLIFTMVESVVLEALPYPEAERLYELRTLYPDANLYSISAPDFMSLRQESRALEQVEAFTGGALTLLGADEPREVRGSRVSDGAFELLGMTVALGRSFRLDEHQVGRGRVVVLDHGYWQRELGADQGVLGRSLLLGGEPHEVIGIMAPGAGLPTGGRRPWLNEADVYTPLEYGESFDALSTSERRGEFLRVIGRARAEVGAQQVDADVRNVGAVLQAAFPETNQNLTFRSLPLREVVIGDVRSALLMLLGATTLVLLAACANVATLMLARSAARRDEIAVRAALGAGRARLVRQLLTESMLLGLLGGAVGLLVAHWGLEAFLALRPANLPRLAEIGVDGTVVIFTLVIALATGIVFGVLPSLRLASGALMGALRERGGGSGSRAQGQLVVAQIALAFVLLMGSGVLLRSLVALSRVEAGFETANAWSVRMVIRSDQEAELTGRVEGLVDRMRSVPGVTAAAATTLLPLSGRGTLRFFAVEGAAPPPTGVTTEIGVISVTPGYFQTMGIPVLAGRDLTADDQADAAAVTIINEAAARAWFGGEDPVGRRVTVGSVSAEVVGVVADVLDRDPTQPVLPELFRPFAQRPDVTLQLVAKAGGGAESAVPSALRAALRSAEPSLPVSDVVPLERLVSGSIASARTYAVLLTVFAAVGLALAAVGMFGLMSYSVAQRSREMSIRLALGAQAPKLVGTVVGRALSLTAVGAVIGTGAAFVLGGVLQSRLFGVEPLDPVTWLIVATVLGTVAALASWVPARRGAGADPAAVLRGTSSRRS
jgi:putative ABC transport system permease protein